MKSKSDEIVAYFVEMFNASKEYDVPANIVTLLNSLDRAERGEMKSRLFNEAKRLCQDSDGIKAIRWLQNAFDILEKNSFRMHEVLFSPGQDIPENIAFHISQAKRSIDLCVFTISDEHLGYALKAAHKRGVRVRLITDGNKMRDTGSQVKDLARAGIHVKVDNSKYHMHNKFGLIDGRIAFTGSYNWTYTAKAYNQENLVITTNYTIVHTFIDEFENLWEEMFALKVKQKKDGRLQATVSVNGQNVLPYFNNDGSREVEVEDDDYQPEPRQPRPEGTAEQASQTNPQTNTRDYRSQQDRKDRQDRQDRKDRKDRQNRQDRQERKDYWKKRRREDRNNRRRQ